MGGGGWLEELELELDLELNIFGSEEEIDPAEKLAAVDMATTLR